MGIQTFGPNGRPLSPRFLMLSHLTLKRKPRLQFQPSVVGRFRETSEAATGRLVGLTKQRRCDIADNGPGVRVIQQVANRHGDGQAVPAAGRRGGEGSLGTASRAENTSAAATVRSAV